MSSVNESRGAIACKLMMETAQMLVMVIQDLESQVEEQARRIAMLERELLRAPKH